MMAAEFSAGPPVRCAAARPLFDFNAGELSLACTKTRCYDVSVDGQHFYGVRTTAPAPPVVTHVNLIFNWFEELKAKVPPAR